MTTILASTAWRAVADVNWAAYDEPGGEMLDPATVALSQDELQGPVMLLKMG
jgi:hypothetical protein